MSYTNKTTNYDLPQWVAADKPTFLQDLNGAFSDIDAQMKTNETAAASAQSTADGNTSAITSLGDTVSSQGTRLTAVEASASASAGNINTINSLIGNGEPTTTDKTLIGAINELDADLNGAGGTASKVSALETKVGTAALETTAPDLCGAVNELNGSLANKMDIQATALSNASIGLISSNNRFPEINVQDSSNNDQIYVQFSASGISLLKREGGTGTTTTIWTITP